MGKLPTTRKIIVLFEDRGETVIDVAWMGSCGDPEFWLALVEAVLEAGYNSRDIEDFWEA